MGKTYTRKRKHWNSVQYTRKHFQSKDGMLTYIWGPPLWHFLHTMSFNYPVSPTREQKKHYRNFILELRYVLPCGKCRDNFVANLKELPPVEKHFVSRESFSRYVYQLHEKVNHMLGKKSGLTFSEVRNRYEHFRARCLSGVSNTDVGCVHPVHRTKSKCLLKIVPLETVGETMEIDQECLK